MNQNIINAQRDLLEFMGDVMKCDLSGGQIQKIQDKKAAIVAQLYELQSLFERYTKGGIKWEISSK